MTDSNQPFLSITCERVLLGLERDDGVGLLDLKNALFPANERLALQLQSVRAAAPQQQRSGSVLFSLHQVEVSGPSTYVCTWFGV